MWRRDVRDVEDQRKELYPKNHDRHLLMAAPLVNRLSKELATLYVQPPARSFVGPVTEATAARINRIYESAEINTVLRTAQECLAALNQATVWVFPVPLFVQSHTRQRSAGWVYTVPCITFIYTKMACWLTFLGIHTYTIISMYRAHI